MITDDQKMIDAAKVVKKGKFVFCLIVEQIYMPVIMGHCDGPPSAAMRALFVFCLIVERMYMRCSTFEIQTR